MLRQRGPIRSTLFWKNNNGPWLAPSGSSLINVGSALDYHRGAAFANMPKTRVTRPRHVSTTTAAFVYQLSSTATCFGTLSRMCCEPWLVHEDNCTASSHGGGISCPCHQAVSKSHFDFRCSPRKVTQISYYGPDISLFCPTAPGDDFLCRSMALWHIVVRSQPLAPPAPIHQSSRK